MNPNTYFETERLLRQRDDVSTESAEELRKLVYVYCGELTPEQKERLAEGESL